MLAGGLAAEGPPERPEGVPAQRLGRSADHRQLPLEPLGEVRAQPGMALELERVGRLVEGDPRPERPDRDVEGPRRGPDVLLDEEKPAVLGLGRQQGEVVLPQHPRAHEPEQEPDLAGRHPAVGDHHRRRGEPATGADDLAEEIALDPGDERAERRDVGPDPAGPVDDHRPLDDPGQGRPEGFGQPRHDDGHRLAVGGVGGLQLERAERAGGGRGPLHRESLHRGPVDEALPRRALGPSPDDGRRDAQGRADEEAGLPAVVGGPVAAPRAGALRPSGVGGAGAHEAALIGVRLPVPGRPRPRSPTRRGRRRRTSARRSPGRRRRRRSSAGRGPAHRLAAAGAS